MLGVSHVLLGAAVGERINNPILAFAAGVVTHLIVDKIPHFWPKTKKYQKALIWADVIGVLALFVIYLFWPLPNKINIFWGAFGAGLVDFVFVIVPMFRPNFMNNPLRVWHEKRQYHHAQSVYLLTDGFLAILSLILILV